MQQITKPRSNTASGPRPNTKPTQNQNSPLLLFHDSKPTMQMGGANGKSNLHINTSKGKLAPKQTQQKQGDKDVDFDHMSKEEILNWKATSEEDLHKMSQKHEQLIGLILSEEEEVIGLHRQHIDDMVELIKQVTSILKELF